MTYPGQPGPYGQQPQPDWQQQPQWQPGPYGQQQPGGWPQQPGQFGPPPPPRSRTGLWVGLTIGAVAVVAFAVTAFAWPGFLVGGDDSTPAGGGGGGGGGGQSTGCQKPDDSGDGGPEAYAQAIVGCINAKDKGVLESLTCGGGNSETRRLIDNLDRISDATLTRTFTKSDTEARAVIEATNDGSKGGFQAVLTKSGKVWCWKRMDAANAR